MSCLRTQRSASGEARTRNPSISGQALYHDCAPQLGSILCRYDTCPTQYAPDLRGSILCMQGTQYAPRESILCMEHFVALQSTLQTVKTQMKSRIMLHFTRVYTICKGKKKDLQTKEPNIFENYKLIPLDMYNGPFQVNCIKPKRESISIQMVNILWYIACSD